MMLRTPSSQANSSKDISSTARRAAPESTCNNFTPLLLRGTSVTYSHRRTPFSNALNDVSGSSPE